MKVIGTWLLIPACGAAINTTMIQRMWIEDCSVFVEDHDEVYEIPCRSAREAMHLLESTLEGIMHRVQICNRYGYPTGIC